MNQSKSRSRDRPVVSVAVRVTLCSPRVTGEPVIAPVEDSRDRPAGRPVAEKLTPSPLLSEAETVRATVSPTNSG